MQLGLGKNNYCERLGRGTSQVREFLHTTYSSELSSNE